ncbi:hypothetical protein ACQKWADRAFT_313949 [Trichoderma austrokoningii]
MKGDLDARGRQATAISTKTRVPATGGLGSGNIATQGKIAFKANAGSNPPGGGEYYTPESVADSISAEDGSR